MIEKPVDALFVCLCITCWFFTSEGLGLHFDSTWKSDVDKRRYYETETWPSTDTTQTQSSPQEEQSATSPYRTYSKTMYGTQEGIQHLRKTYGPTGLPLARSSQVISQELEDIRLANEHFLKMRNEGKCKTPLQRIVKVKDFYPDPSKEYLPRCTTLHRCGEESGCCDSEAFECVARSVQEVTYTFYTIHLGRTGKPIGLSNTIEKLLFVNHTECECQPINDIPRTQDMAFAYGKNHGYSGGFSRCKECPTPFYMRIFPDGRCNCDCFDRQKPCLKVKRGREPLSEVERRCVIARRCHLPECEYGEYDVYTGRCPKRPDDYHRISGKRGNNPHRWTHIERD